MAVLLCCAILSDEQPSTALTFPLHRRAADGIVVVLWGVDLDAR
jgi:hypothetical protein